MTSGQEVVLGAKLTSIAVLLLLLLFRRSYRCCYSLPAYLLGVLLPDLALIADPSLFNWQTWIAVEALHAVLKFTLAAELGWRLFAALPGARGTLAAGLLLVALVTLAAVVGAPLSAPAHVVAQTALARVLHGTAWVFGAIQGAKLYYRIPAHPLHAAILRGLVPFLLVFTVALGLLETFGRDVRLLASYGYTLAYQALLLYWIVVVWRRQETPTVPPHVLHTLQPWR